MGLSLLLGYVGFAWHLRGQQPPYARIEILYRSLQLFVLEDGTVRDAPWPLNVARFLGPLTAAYTALQALLAVFGQQLAAVRLLRLKRHVVLCGLGANGEALARDFLRAGIPVVAVEKNEANIRAHGLREAGAIVRAGDACDPAELAAAGIARARYLVALTGDDGTNVEIALAAGRVPECRSAARESLAVLVHVVDADLCAMFQRHAIFTQAGDALDVRIINTYEATARALFLDALADWGPSGADDPRAPRLLIAGFGQMGQSVALQAARMLHPANGRRLQVAVFDRDLARCRDAFLGRYPAFPSVCDVEFVEADLQGRATLDDVVRRATEPGQAAAIVLALEQDSENASIALGLRARLGRAEVPVLVRLGREGGMAALLGGTEPAAGAARLRPFGMVAATCTRGVLIHEELDTLARTFHEQYAEARRREGRPATDPGLAPWERLTESYRLSNRLQADHIPFKLRAVGCRAVPAGTAGRVEEFAADDVERLARMEHARWAAERLLEGWVPGEGPQDPASRTSPHLVPWDRLPEPVREYDREIVRRIPRLLEAAGQWVCRRPAGP
jgi:voltage-gated potassium channel Kch